MKDIFEDKEALMIQDSMGETVISFLEVDEGGASMAIFTCDGMCFMLMPDQVEAIAAKIAKIMVKRGGALQ